MWLLWTIAIIVAFVALCLIILAIASEPRSDRHRERLRLFGMGSALYLALFVGALLATR